MKRLVLIVVLAACTVAGCGSSSSSTGGTSASGPSPEIPPALADALDKAAASGVPVRIPPQLLSSLPAGANHAEVLRSPPDSYTLGLSARPDCRFKSSCVVALFAGSSGSGELSGGGRRLELAEGIGGVYEPGRCGPGCKFGTVAWRQNGDTYGVGVPNASVDELVLLADEAIEAPPVAAEGRK
jgi:hypothetical protein